jgi:hypothetical protein
LSTADHIKTNLTEQLSDALAHHIEKFVNLHLLNNAVEVLDLAAIRRDGA